MSHSKAIYCVKCKSHTPTGNASVVTTKNNRHRLVGTCSQCGIKKSQFISSQEGSGLLGKLLHLPGDKVPLLGDIPLLGMLF